MRRLTHVLLQYAGEWTIYVEKPKKIIANKKLDASEKEFHLNWEVYPYICTIICCVSELLVSVNCDTYFKLEPHINKCLIKSKIILVPYNFEAYYQFAWFCSSCFCCNWLRLMSSSLVPFFQLSSKWILS